MSTSPVELLQSLAPRAIALALAIASFAVSPCAAENASGRYDDDLAAYERLDSAGRERWLAALLLERSEPACRACMNAEELAHALARHREILGRAAAGRQLSQRGLLRLLAEVDHQEQRAIDYLAREFAFAIAQAFHRDRAEFELRNEAWRRIERRWTAAGQPLDWQPRIIAWLQRATPRHTPTPPVASRSQPPPAAIRAPITRPRIQEKELAARITAWNLALSRLVARLHEQSQWTAAGLDEAADKLAALAATRYDLNLYWRLLSPETQARMLPLQPLDTAISLLASRTSQRRRQLQGTSSETAADVAHELHRLDDVSRRLATLASTRS